MLIVDGMPCPVTEIGSETLRRLLENLPRKQKNRPGMAIPRTVFVCQFGILSAKADQPLVRISIVLTIRLKSVTR